MEQIAPSRVKALKLDGLVPGVYLIGAGPGAADLITVRGSRILAQADIVFYDALIDLSMLDWCSSTKLVQVGKRCGSHSSSQHFINKQLVDAASKYSVVVRLKGGDPFVFGRGGEEAQALVAAGVPCVVVPGITSALGAASASGIPLTHRAHASAVVFLTGHEDPAKPDSAIRWEDYGKLGATLCIYMGMKNLETITRRLQAGGMPPETPAAVIQSATTAGQRQHVSTVAQLALESERAGFGAPAIVVIGAVAALSEELHPIAALAHAGGAS